MDNSGFNTFQRLAQIADDVQRFKFPVLVDNPEKIASHRVELSAIAERDIKTMRTEIDVTKQSLSQLQSQIHCLDGFSKFMASMASKHKQIEQDFDEITKFGKKYMDIPAVNIEMAKDDDNEKSDEKELSDNCSLPVHENIKEPKLEDYPFSDLTMKWLKAAEAGQNTAHMPLSFPTPHKVVHTPDNSPNCSYKVLHQNMVTPSDMWNKGLFVTPGMFDINKPPVKTEMPASEPCVTMATPEEPVFLTEQWSLTTENLQSPVSPKFTTLIHWPKAE